MKNKELYKLNELDWQVSRVKTADYSIKYQTKIYKFEKTGRKLIDIVEGGAHSDLLNWLEQDVIKEDILTESERRYLKEFINPFRERVSSIHKGYCYYGGYKVYYIKVNYQDDLMGDSSFCLPFFKEEKDVYKRMELNKLYSLKDLNL